MARLHVTFSELGGMTVKDALAKLQINEHVISSNDDLGYGPLEPFDVDARAKFQRQALGIEVPAECMARAKAFWDAALQPGVDPVLWLSRRCVRELAGCMELLSRCHAPPIAIDVADTGFMHQGRRRDSESCCLASLNPERIVEYRLLERADCMTRATFDCYRSAWAALRTENAPLRVIVDGALQSAPISFFDELLLSCAPNAWTMSARVVGDAIVKAFEEPYVQFGDRFLISRLFRLIAEGRLEGQGDLSTLRDTRVRKAPAPR